MKALRDMTDDELLEEVALARLNTLRADTLREAADELFKSSIGLGLMAEPMTVWRFLNHRANTIDGRAE